MPDALVEHLNAAAARLIGRPVGERDRFGLAVSGGADSMAMLALATQSWPGQVEAATVDHGLRPEAADEAAMVGGWCAAHDIPHAVLRPEAPIAGNLQSEARAARYVLLEGWCAERRLDWLLTAHQADDQIETFIMRLNRGSGVGGLASVRARRGSILRPLLGVRRTELRAFCEKEGVPFVDDPSNENKQFDRVRLRHALSGSDYFDVAGVNRSAETLAETDAALDWITDEIATHHVHAQADAMLLDRTDLPPAILRRLLEQIIRSINVNGQIPRGPSLDQALVQLFHGKTVTLADCVVTGGARWTVRRAPPRRTG